MKVTNRYTLEHYTTDKEKFAELLIQDVIHLSKACRIDSVDDFTVEIRVKKIEGEYD